MRVQSQERFSYRSEVVRDSDRNIDIRKRLVRLVRAGLTEQFHM